MVHWSLVLGALFVSCTAADTSETDHAPEPAGERPVRLDPYAGSESRYGEVDIHAGFTPDPYPVRGAAKGVVLANTIHRKCRGWVGEKPDFLLRASTAFLKLHILARSRADVLLVVRTPDGKVLCNDNRYGDKNPMVHSSFPIGTTQVFVGTPKQGQETPYTLGFSELEWKPSRLALP